MSGLGDITESTFFQVKNSPYVQHTRDTLRPPQFRVPRSGDPYYLHALSGLEGDEVRPRTDTKLRVAILAGWALATHHLYKKKSNWKYVTGAFTAFNAQALIERR